MIRRIRRRVVVATRDREAGIGSLEYVGMVVAAALLVGALVLAVTRSRVGDHVAAALCEIASLGQGECAAPPVPERAPEDYVPPDPCVVQADGAGWSASGAAVLQVEGGQTWLYETLDDGRVRLTRTDDTGVGGEVGAGFDVSLTLDDETYGAALTAGAAALLTEQEGDVFYAADREEAERILSAQRTDDVKDPLLGDDGWVRDAWDWTTDTLGGSTRYEHREPDETFVRTGVQLTGQAGVTAIYGAADAGIELGIHEGTTTRADGTTTDVYSTSGEVRASAGSWLTRLDNPWGPEGYGVATASGAARLTIEVDRDADGEVVAMRVVTLTGAHADTYSTVERDTPWPDFTENTVQIPLETAADRRTGARVAQALGLPVSGLTDDLAGWERPLNTVFMYDNLEDYFELAKERGYLYQDTFGLDESTYGAAFDAKLLLEVGLGGDYTTVERTTLKNVYWNGQELVERSGCVQ